MATIKVDGYGFTILWPAGEIRRLMDQGYSYQQAKEALAGEAESGRICKNLVVNVGKHMVGDFLRNDADYTTGITYCEIGLGNTTPAASDTGLTSPGRRKSITQTSRTGSEIQLESFFPASDCDYHIQEVGWFGGQGAGASLGTGTLFSHYIENEDNQGGAKDITFVYRLTVS